MSLEINNQATPAIHVLELQVRDYECDIQGVVNNAVYQNYLEHARHEYIQTLGINFAEFARKKINLVLARIELEYKRSLTPGDRFLVQSQMIRLSKLKFGFKQTIVTIPDEGEKGVVALTAMATAVALNEKGRPFIPEELETILPDLK
jgi:acyl-CoA thioester hydrolase